MPHAEVPSDILSSLYATVSDRSKWPEFCEDLGRTTGVPIMMFGHNLSNDESLGIIASGIDPEQLVTYHQHFADQNPWMHMNAVMPVGMVGVSDQALRREDLVKTEFYNDWLQPQGNILGGPFMMCHRTSETFVGMAAACPAKVIDQKLTDSQRFFEALAPHLLRSISLSSCLANGGSSSFSHLDASRHGIIVLCRSGRVGFVNAAAGKILTQSQSLVIDQFERLVARHEKLQSYLCASQRAMMENAFTDLPTPIRIDTDDCRNCILHAHIFPADRNITFPQIAWADPVVGAFVISGPLGLTENIGFYDLARSLGASPAEARLAQALMDGQTLYDYSDLTGLSRHTVRNQMRALLQKTGTGNQVEFVSLLHTISSPFTSEKN